MGEGVIRCKRRLKKLQKQYSEGKVDLDKVRSSVHSWIGHAKHGDTYGLRKSIFGNISFQRA